MIKDDNINHPSHYTRGKIEVISFIEDQRFDYNEANVVKYVCRYKFKNAPLEDLLKARWYLNRLIRRERSRKAKTVVR